MSNDLLVAYHEGKMDAFSTVLANRAALGLSQSAAEWLLAQHHRELDAKNAEAVS